MNPNEMKNNLILVRRELERLTVTGVQTAKSIAGMANVLDQCIAALDTKEDNDA